MRLLAAITLLSLATLAGAWPIQTNVIEVQAEEQKAVTLSLPQGETREIQIYFRSGTNVTDMVDGETPMTAEWLYKLPEQTVWNVITANVDVVKGLVNFTWTPNYDTGDARYNGWLHVIATSTPIYRLRLDFGMIKTPGFLPNAVDGRVKVTDYALLSWSNEPWATPAQMSNESARAIAVATNLAWIAGTDLVERATASALVVASNTSYRVVTNALAGATNGVVDDATNKAYIAAEALVAQATNDAVVQLSGMMDAATNAPDIARTGNSNVFTTTQYLYNGQYNSPLLVIGSNAPPAMPDIYPYPVDIYAQKMRLGGNSNATVMFLLDCYSTNANRYGYVSFRKSHTNVYGVAEPTVNSEVLGSFVAGGFNSASSSASAAYFWVRQDGTGGVANIPGRIMFDTATATSAPLNRMVIKSDGRVGIGTAAPTSTLEVAGDVTIGGYLDMDGHEITNAASGTRPNSVPVMAQLTNILPVATAPSLSSDILALNTWSSSSNWVGNQSEGWTNLQCDSTVGVLSNSWTPTAAGYYYVNCLVSNRTIGSFVLQAGAFTSVAVSADTEWGFKAVNTDPFTVSPTTNFNGTLYLSAKLITASSAQVNYLDAAGTSVFQQRWGDNTSRSLFWGTGGARNLAIRNIGFGIGSLALVTTGQRNTAFGDTTLAANLMGMYNSAFGSAALGVDVNGNYNAAFGASSAGKSVDGGYLAAFGQASLNGLISGSYNSGFGYGTYYTMSTGQYNTAIGAMAGRTVITGTNNVFVGANAGYHASQKVGVTNSMALGANSYTTLDNQTVLGGPSTTQTLFNGQMIGNASGLTNIPILQSWNVASPLTNWGFVTSFTGAIRRITSQAYSGGSTAVMFRKLLTSTWDNVVILGTMPVITNASQSNVTWAIPTNQMVGVAFTNGASQPCAFMVEFR